MGGQQQHHHPTTLISTPLRLSDHARTLLPGLRRKKSIYRPRPWWIIHGRELHSVFVLLSVFVILAVNVYLFDVQDALLHHHLHQSSTVTARRSLRQVKGRSPRSHGAATTGSDDETPSPTIANLGDDDARMRELKDSSGSSRSSRRDERSDTTLFEGPILSDEALLEESFDTNLAAIMDVP
jgi:hypothetical protein